MLDAVLEKEKRNTYLRLETCLKSLSSLLGATLVAMWQSVEMCVWYLLRCIEKVLLVELYIVVLVRLGRVTE